MTKPLPRLSSMKSSTCPRENPCTASFIIKETPLIATISVPSGAKTDRDVNAAIDLIEAEVEKLDEAIRNRMDEIANLIDDAGYGPARMEKK